MSLIIVPATRENLEKSIEKSVDISFAKKYLNNDFVGEIVKYSGLEGIRCWALTKNRVSIFNDIQNGDEVLLTEKGTGRFTHYGVVIGKVQNVDYGNALWPILGENPWEYIYFLANITAVNLNKKTFVQKLGFAENYTVPGVNLIDETKYSFSGSISSYLEIPIFDNVAETNENKDFFAKNVQANGKIRVGHSKFSIKVKSNYNYSCAICGINETEFLIAGHISTWAEDENNRLNPQNGICLCSLHDKAFEHGYIGLSDDYKIILNKKINKGSKLFIQLQPFEGKSIQIPKSDKPGIGLLKTHRKKHNLE